MNVLIEAEIKGKAAVSPSLPGKGILGIALLCIPLLSGCTSYLRASIRMGMICRWKTSLPANSCSNILIDSSKTPSDRPSFSAICIKLLEEVVDAVPPPFAPQVAG